MSDDWNDMRRRDLESNKLKIDDRFTPVSDGQEVRLSDEVAVGTDLGYRLSSVAHGNATAFKGVAASMCDVSDDAGADRMAGGGQGDSGGAVHAMGRSSVWMGSPVRLRMSMSFQQAPL